MLFLPCLRQKYFCVFFYFCCHLSIQKPPTFPNYNSWYRYSATQTQLKGTCVFIGFTTLLGIREVVAMQVCVASQVKEKETVPQKLTRRTLSKGLVQAMLPPKGVSAFSMSAYHPQLLLCQQTKSSELNTLGAYINFHLNNNRA